MATDTRIRASLSRFGANSSLSRAHQLDVGQPGIVVEIRDRLSMLIGPEHAPVRIPEPVRHLIELLRLEHEVVRRASCRNSKRGLAVPIDPADRERLHLRVVDHGAVGTFEAVKD
ncbi:hypothetical protein CWR43_06195 [Rhizobium sullae]|uniref:Uncharacterized protein n=1 Tax=Rhizobium sullae TaxID=50338 RepID=A0A2N0DEI1_RHISU|nr:hypothetical protein CWR43_06195 [Rhizobium sullae]